MSRPRLLTGSATVAFAAGFSALAVLQHRAFWTGRFDVGNLVQAVWATAGGDVLEVTNLRGDQMSRLGAHFDPIVALFAPLWWVWPDAALLLVAQACAVASGAPAAYLIARRRLGSDTAAAGIALSYLLYPATQWLVVDDFHPVALATPLLLWGFWFLETDRRGWFVIVAVLACLTKEHVGLVVAAMGLWYALRPGRRAFGTAVAAAAATVSILAVTVVVPHYAPGRGSPFAGRYAAVGGSPGGILETAVRDPGAIVSALSDGRDGAYLVDLLAPLLALPLLAPLAALTAAPEILLNLLSATPTQTSIRFHYSAAAIPGLVMATVVAVATVRRRSQRLGRWLPHVLVVTTLVSGVLLGPIPVWRHVPFGATAGATHHLAGRHAEAARAAVALVPPGAPVSASNTLGAHLSERRRVFSFPVVREARWIVVDTMRPSWRDQADAPSRFRAALARVRASGNWTVVREADGILVLRRTTAAP